MEMIRMGGGTPGLDRVNFLIEKRDGPYVYPLFCQTEDLVDALKEVDECMRK